jgi:hypothetical protein
VPTTPPLKRILDDYEAICSRPARYIGVDKRRSVLFYRMELSAMAREPVSSASSNRVERWIAALLSLELFISVHGRWPTAATYRDPAGSVGEERRIAVWVRTQRVRSVKFLLCDYQTRRLLAVQDFQFRPREDRWFQTATRYSEFVRDMGHAPRLRSEDASEKALAAWGAKQRLAKRNGTLPLHRADHLRHLLVPAWGVPPAEVSPGRWVPRT